MDPDILKGLTPQQRDLLARRLRRAEPDAAAAPERIPVQPRDAAGGGAFPVSFAQERFWFLDRLEPGSTAYNIPAALAMRGRLAVPALAAALGAIVRRHETLRTTFELTAPSPPAGGEGALVQRVRPAPPDGARFPLPVVDLSALPPARREGEARLRLAAAVDRPFDLERDPMMRVVLLRLAAAEHVAVLTMHHIASDGWSSGVLVRELGALYRSAVEGQPARLTTLPELPVQYADFAVWQRDWLRGEVLERKIAFWRERLAGAVPLELPLDRPRPPAQTFGGAVVSFTLPAPLAAAAGALGRQQGATFFMTALAAFAALLHRLSGQEDLTVGTPHACRDQGEVAELIGPFVNTVTLRADLAGAPSFAALLGRLRAETLSAFAHRDVPFEKVVEELRPERTLSVPPLFQVLFNLLNARMEALDLPGLTLAPHPYEANTAKLDLTLTLEEGTDGCAADLEHNVDLFDRATIERLAAQYTRLLAAAVADPERRIGELPLLSAAERSALLEAGNDTRAERPPGLLVHELFTAQAARTPAAPAVTSGAQELTYAELDARSNRLARHLRRLGVEPEVRVGLCLERTPELVVALLAVLKAGGAYVPLDPGHPAERLDLVLEDAGAAVLVTEERWLGLLPAHGPRVLCVDRDGAAIAAERSSALTRGEIGDESLAYVIYTSGSTGRPKGVQLPHRAVVSFLLAMAARPGLTARDVVPALTTISFDIAGLEIYLPLAVGARVEMVSREEASDGALLAARLAACGATVVQATPATWRMLVETPHPRPLSHLPPTPRRERGEIREKAGQGLQGHQGLQGPEDSGLQFAKVLPSPGDGRVGDGRGAGGEVLAGAAGFAVRALCGGEALPRDLAEALRPRVAELWNVYGPTETAIWSAAGEVEPGDGPVPLGAPIANTRLYVIDRADLAGEPAPLGVPGELWIAGDGVARGYLGRPGLTAERFVPDPFAAAAGARLYRTGDLVRRRVGGALEFLGRIDHQVKVRGFRIELGEIETALRRHPAVAQAVVVVKGEGEERRLVAYLVAGGEQGQQGHEQPEPGELQEHLRRTLPEYMVPSAFVVLPALPLTPSGKVDRKALPAPDSAALAAGRYVAPNGPLEERLAALWAEVLGVERVGAEDNFFTLGGHSLLATRIVSRVRAELGAEVPLRRMFEQPTVSGLARVIAGLKTDEAPGMLPLMRLVHSGPPRLSFAQERLWFLDRLDPGSVAYNLPAALRLVGALDVAALRASLNAVVRRHEALRTTFVESGEGPRQVIAPALEIALPVVDLGGLPAAERHAEVAAWSALEAWRPFDLAQGPLVRVTLLRLGTDEWTLLFNLHHIVSDAWSLDVLVREIAALYPALREGRPAALGELPIQYADYAEWQRAWLADPAALAAQLAWWRERLAGAPAVSPLPTDRPRPPVQRFHGRNLRQEMPADAIAALRRVCAREGATLFMGVLTGLFAVLARHAGTADLTVGTPVAGRTRVEVEELIGLFLNTLVLRMPAFSATAEDLEVRELLARTRELTLGAFAHQDLPFAKLVEELAPERNLSQTPLFQVQLALLAAAGEPLRLPGLTLESLHLEESAAKLDLTLRANEGPDGLDLVWQYNTDLFDAATIARLGLHFARLLAAAAADPGRRLADLPLLSAGEEHQLLAEWNDTNDPSIARWLVEAGGAGSLHALIAAQARRTPGRPAVCCAGQVLTYAELLAAARRLAGRLWALGVGPDVVVAVCAERSLEMVVGLLAILEAGGAYLPLDPSYPADRLAYMLDDAAAPVLLAQERLLDLLPALLPAHGAAVIALDGVAAPGAESGVPVLPLTFPDSLAYVIYTSGSTGRPKGTMNSHRGIVNRLLWMQDRYGLTPDDAVLQKTPFSFDVSVWEFFWPLLVGARLVMALPGGHRDPAYLVETIAGERITTLHFVPSMLRVFANAPGVERCASIRRVMASGEALPPETVRRFHARLGAELHNLYGPTEAAVDVTFWECEREGGSGSVPIGRPVSNTRILLLDQTGQAVPAGVAGELHIGGVQLARGYLARPDLTADRFVPDPLALRWNEPGARLYRSGDLARFLPDGAVEFLGRIDHQVKVRGFRIELGEIEAALAVLPGVRDAVAAARTGEGSEARLIAYLAVDPAGPRPDLGEVRTALARTLPEHMLPAALVILPALPLTPSGKVDRKALPAPAARPAAAGSPVAPRTPLESWLAGLWREVLGEAVSAGGFGVHDNFFALGGSSISGAVLVNRLQRELAEIVHVVVIFDRPTIAELAAYLAEQHGAAVARLLPGSASVSPASAGAGETPALPGSRVDSALLDHFRALIRQPAPLPAPAERNPPAVFILSPPRAGSTLLRVMLGGNPALFAPPELELLGFATLAERGAAFTGRDAFRLEGAIRAVMEARRCGADEAREQIAALAAAGETVPGFYSRLQEWIGGRMLVDKTPTYAWSPAVLERAEEIFDRPRYVHLLRHPYAAIRSFEEARLEQIFFPRANGFSRRQLAEMSWLLAEGNIEGFLESIPEDRRHSVRFEDLVAAPEESLRALCAALGIAYHPDMADPYKDGASRMTDGLRAASRMLGDVKFHQHAGVDARAAERWRELAAEDFLGAETREMAARLGYETGGWEEIPRAEQDGPLPLSFAQERLWFLDRLEPGRSTYNLANALRLTGRLDATALARALAGVVERHSVLRTTYAEGPAGPVQVVGAPFAPPSPLVDLRALPAALRDAEARRQVAAEADRPFDLQCGPLLRALLLRLAPDEHLAVLTMHHIASDGWSMGVLVREVAALYAGAPLPEPAIQYADFAVWQRRRLRGALLEGQLAWWRQRLGGVAPLDLPTDHPRPPVQTFRGARVPAAVPAATAGVIARLGQRERATPFMTALAGFVALLSRWSGQDDVAVGTPHANRDRAEIEPLIGFFVNTLTLRSDASPTGFRGLVARVRESALGAFAHREVPFEKVVEELHPERDLSRSPLFQVMFILQNNAAGTLELPGLTIAPYGFAVTTAKFDLTLALTEEEGGFAGSFELNADLFERATIARLADHYRNLLAGAAADPERAIAELPLLSAAERSQVLEGWNDTRAERPRDLLIHALFITQAAATPAAPAVSCGSEVVTYAELDAQSNRLARSLIRLGVGAEVRVGLCLDRTPAMVVGLLAVLKAGGAYVPLDPGHPAERTGLILEDAGIAALVTEERWLGLFTALPADVPALCLDRDRDAIAHQSAAPLPPRADAESLAYVIYTSGSTGRPKGVELPHRAVVNFLLAMAERPGLTAADVVPAVTTLTFDIAGLEIYLPLAVGGRVEVVRREEAADGVRLAARLVACGATVLQATPATWRLLLDGGWGGPHPRPLSQLPPPDPRERGEKQNGEGLLASSCLPSPGGGAGGAGRGAGGEGLAGVADPIGSSERRPLRALCGGEALPRDLAAALRPRVAELWNVYGPTETAIWSAAGLVAAGGPVLLGAPIANTRFFVVDREGEPAPVGVPGELWIAGDGLARGYRGRPDLTAERFAPDPFADRPGARLYRTGDLVRWRGAGNHGGLEFLGRIDHQVKVRGYRIEPGEVEAALARHPAVAQAVVAVRADDAGDRRLVAWLTPRGGQEEPPVRDLRAFLLRSLPDFMVPSAFMSLPAFPLTPSGKVDRRALPDPLPAVRAAQGHIAPEGPVEELLAGIWSAVLRREEVGAEDGFFDLGGHSLLATQVVSRIRAALGVDLPLQRLFETPTVRGLGRAVAAARRAGEGIVLPPIERAPRGAGSPPLPLSFAQERIWFLHQLDPGLTAYNLINGVRLRGSLDPVILARCLTEIVRRHEALRTRFPMVDGQPAQTVLPPGSFSLERVDLRGLPAERREGEIRRLGADLDRPLDLARDPLFEVALVELSNEDWFLYVLAHHVVSDGWSNRLLIRELVTLYAADAADAADADGRPSPLPELPIQYPDFAVWQRGWLAGAVLETQLAYWRRQLAGAPPVLELPTDRPRPAVQTFHGSRHEFALAPEPSSAVKMLSRRRGSTPFMILLATFEALLWRYTAAADLIVGVPIANRNRAELESLIGTFVNMLALRTRVAGGLTFAELAARVRETALGAYGHQDLPFEKLVDELRPERSLSYPPLFQVMFNLQNQPVEPMRLPGLSFIPIPTDRNQGQVDLTLALAEALDGTRLEGFFEFNTDLFDAATVQRIAGHYRNLLAGILADPERPLAALPILDDQERWQLLEGWNDTRIERDGGVLIHDLVSARAMANPAAPAVSQGPEVVTYGELEARSNRLARHLRRLGAGPEVRVGLCLERTPELVVALLAVLKAGGAYVPLDPSHPAERIGMVLADAGATLLVTEERWLPLLAELPPHGARVVCVDRDREAIAAHSPTALPPLADAESLAYVIYTSGSTGRPKGVQLPHRAVVNFLLAMAERPGVTAADVVPALTTITFDIAGLEIYLPLLAGGRVEMVGREEATDGVRLAARLAACGATLVQATPATWRLLLAAGAPHPQPLSHLPPTPRRERGELQEEARQKHEQEGPQGHQGRQDSGLQFAEVLPSPGDGWVGDGRGAGGEVPFRALCGGEALPRDLADELWLRASELWNVYGPTETAIWSSAGPVAAGGGPVLLGPPIANTRFYVLDAACGPVPVGVAGELWIGGAGLARGYLGRPDLTAERFVPDPFGGQPGARAYRTGDLVRYRHAGNAGELEFLGRIDHQVKVRGYRIELGEIEAALGRHPAVGQAVAVARDEGGEKRLVAYLTPVPSPIAPPPPGEGGQGGEAFRAFLLRSLPEYMVPAFFVTLAAFPLTPSGKIDRRALPAPEPAVQDGQAYVAPRGAVEELLAEIWAAVLRVERVGAEDGFFDLGGHSLLATQVMSRIRAALGVELPLQRLFEAPTVRNLARAVEEARGLREAVRLPPLVAVPRAALGHDIPLSFAQERMWFLHQLDAASSAYNLPGAVRLRGDLDAAALERSLSGLMARHEALRTVFAPGTSGDGSPVQVILPPSPFRLQRCDLRGLQDAVRESELRRLASEMASRPFDLTGGPLLRAALVRLGANATGEEEHVLLLVVHHIVADGWSWGVLVRELAGLYDAFAGGEAPDLPPLPVQYADFAVWQRRALAGETLEAELAWWRSRLGGSPPALLLPADRRRSAGSGFRMLEAAEILPPDLARGLRALARRNSASLYMLLLAGWDALLARATAQEDVLVGAPIANRNRVETEGLIGFFLNTLLLRTDLAGDPAFEEVVGRVRETALGAFTHQDLPLEQVLRSAGWERGLESPFQVMFLMQNLPRQELAVRGLTFSPFQADLRGLDLGTAIFEAGLTLVEREDGGLDASLTYNGRLFDAATMHRLLARYRRLLTAAVEDPGRRLWDLELMSGEERAEVLAGSGRPSPRVGEGFAPVHRLFAARAAATPEAAAVMAMGTAMDGDAAPGLSYGELDRRANRLARHLLARGIGPEAVVGIALDRSPELVVALLAVLKAGAAYLPLDPGYPAERLAFILDDARAAALVSSRGVLGRLAGAPAKTLLIDLEADAAAIAAQAAENPCVEVAAESLAYLIYTSGSTGRPKGVMVPHGALANYVTAFRDEHALGPADRVLQFAAISFDTSAEEIYPCLASGATLVLRGDDMLGATEDFLALCGAWGITVLDLPTAFWHGLAAHLTQAAAMISRESPAAWPRALRLVIIGGERALPEHVAAWRELAPPGVRLINTYGPTETTIVATRADLAAGDAAELDPAAEAPIGSPVPAATAWVVDPAWRLAPPGIAGELWVGGAGVARGYAGRPDLTAERFLPDPWSEEPGARVYRTGDLVRLRASGGLEFIGRADQQVKIRGFRVELREIEAALGAHPAVGAAVVTAREERPGDRRLAAYVVPRGAARPPEGEERLARELRAFLAGRLPDFMVPSAFVLLGALPLTPSGKVDRNALPPPEPKREAPESAPPGSESEEIIAGIWRDVLGVERVGLGDDFFALGGHSLLLPQLVHRLRAAFQVDVPVRLLFAEPTLEGMALTVEEALLAEMEKEAQMAG